MSDERASGVIEVLADCEFTEDGEATNGVCSGTITLSNDDGTWEGTTEGTTSWTTSDPTHVHDLDATLLGTGAYDGLRLVTRGRGHEHTVDSRGTHRTSRLNSTILKTPTQSVPTHSGLSEATL